MTHINNIFNLAFLTLWLASGNGLGYYETHAGSLKRMKHLIVTAQCPYKQNAMTLSTQTRHTYKR